jgi:hypothetical protein
VKNSSEAHKHAHIKKRGVLFEKANTTEDCNETRRPSYSLFKGDRFIGREKHSRFEKQCCQHIL